jgi:hypothetical protein
MASTINGTSTGNGGLISTGDDSGILNIQTNETTAITVDASQNVGIGTTTPLYTAANRQTTTINGGTGGAMLSFGISGTGKGSIFQNNSDILNISGYPSAVTFSSGATDVERMRIDSSGYLLVGTTSKVADGKISTSFAGNAINGATFNDTTNASGSGFVIFTVNGTTIGNISRVSTTNAVAYNTTSDERLKSNIADSQSVIDKLMTVKVRQYDWTEGTVHQDYGFIAQELEPILSGIVSKGKTDEDMWQLDYAKLTPHLVKAIQELKTINDTQAETINALTARIVALETA